MHKTVSVMSARWAVGLTLAAGAVFHTQAQEYRDTAVPNAQIPNVLRDVAQWHDFQHPDCKYKQSVGSVRAKGEDGDEEHWTIVGCDGRKFTYRVSVISQHRGGVTVLVGNLGGEPVKQKPKVGKIQHQRSCADVAEELATFGNDINKVPSDRIAQLAADNAACQSEAKAAGDR